MENVTVIDVDLPTSVFQPHDTAAEGSVVFRNKLLRVQFQKFMERHSRYRAAMQAYATAHH